MSEIIRLLVAVLLTMIIELIVLYIYKVRDLRLWLSLPINVLTNLLLNTSLSLIKIYWLYVISLIIGEILVFLIEWFLYNLIKKDKKNWQYSLTANITSFVFGAALMQLLFLFN